MHDNVPTYEPAEITAGETLEWTKDLDDFPASEWELKYYFRGAGAGFDATAAADGDTHAVTVPSASTLALAAGDYYWQAWVTKGDEKHLVASGQVTVKPSLAALSAVTTFDGRSDVKKMLDAIDAVLKNKATKDQQEYQIGNRMLRRYTPEQLLTWRRYYAGLYAKEAGRARGPIRQHIEMRFDEP